MCNRSFGHGRHDWLSREFKPGEATIAYTGSCRALWKQPIYFKDSGFDDSLEMAVVDKRVRNSIFRYSTNRGLLISVNWGVFNLDKIGPTKVYLFEFGFSDTNSICSAYYLDPTSSLRIDDSKFLPMTSPGY